MDVFKLREAVVGEYKDYVESFVRVLDPLIDGYVREKLAAGELWPDSVLQLNPAYEPTDSLGELAASTVLRPETARFFGEGIRLHRHQRDALAAAQRNEPYVVSTGTGSGKSLTYLVPIYDAILQAEPARHSVRAIIVYPMNALINSQFKALEAYAKNFPNSPVTFGKYTGETKIDDRPAILNDPPHILLTNYVMLEYILTRPAERSLLETATRDLRFLVMDELHFYRGRQGADVAMLLRRLQQRAGHDLQVIGTSATIATEGNRDQRRGVIAVVATRLFGVNVPAANVIDETLQRLTSVPTPSGADALRAAVLADPPTATRDSVTAHPLCAWIEEAFGIAHSADGIIRREPETFEGAVERLAQETSLEEVLCRQRLRAALDAGNAATLQTGEPVFAFRLHQFLSSGSSVYSTLEPPSARELTMEAQYKVEGDRILYPLAFCRQCGQEYYLVSLDDDDGEKLIPRSPMVGAADEDTPGEGGFFALEDGELWHGEDDELPDFWFDELKSGPRLKKGYGNNRPREYHAKPDGSLSTGGNGVRGWFQPRPLMLCLRCRAAFDLRNTSDFRKLSSLSQTGRSTATTIVVNAAVAGMRQDPTVDPDARKILSFTDNRQDASLQAGHLNDFVQVAQLRAGVVAAIERNGGLTFDRLGPAVFEAMNLQPGDFLQTPVPVGTPGYVQGRRAMEDLLEYKTLEDLGRDWRVAQPNLEQVGLLKIEYQGLRELAADDNLWRGLPAIAEGTPTKREEVLRAFLDHLRMQLAIESDALTQDFTRRLVRNTGQWLREPWALGERDRLPLRSIALLPSVQPDHQEALRSVARLGARSAVARYLRSHWTWSIDRNLDAHQADELVGGIVERLKGHLLFVEKKSAEDHGVRVLAGALRWTAGPGNVPAPDPVRSRALYLRREIPGAAPNRFFSELYGQAAGHLRGMLGREHTGQIASERRVERETRFGNGQLPVLFCSPTMELGIDIRDLNAVHMRNVPPTPANYAQRSGRAGRGGRPALVVTFAAQGNVHDQYFFRRRERVIAGAVAPSRMDLRNPELIEAHLYATWLATVGLPLGRGMAEILDLGAPPYPIQVDVHAQIYDPRHEIPALQAARDVIGRAPELRDAWWFSEKWLEDNIRNASEKFDRAFDRWRETYQAAVEMRESARKAMDSPTAPRHEREAAEQRHKEALREIDLLLNRTTHLEADFYPYRYLASEGFLPGYNFPRLPVRALVSVGSESEAIDRPRFLGLAEFGPHNVIYHEGQKHRIDSAILPQNGIEERFRQARLCLECGYAHSDDSLTADLCEHCGTRLDGENSLLPQRLLEQPVMRTRARERISSDEEERLRNGYRITTHFEFIPPWRPRRASVTDSTGELVIALLSAPAGVLWRINHGWRQGDHTGFVIDPQDGRWQSQAGQADGDEDPIGPQPIPAVKPFVKDNRNVLLLLPEVDAPSPSFQYTLLHALKRAIQLVYQVEEQEVAAELIGRGANQRLLLWEAAEGGTGAWERLLEERDGFAQLARKALELCHFDPTTGAEDPAYVTSCAVACYECLLSYANQQEQRYLDRHVVRDFLLRLAQSHTSEPVHGRTREEQYEWLLSVSDPASPHEKRFIQFLHEHGYQLPTEAQNRPEADLATQPDFYYARDGVAGACVFVDGAEHQQPARKAADDEVRSSLADRGYRVIVIQADQPFDIQVQDHPDIFGRAS